MKKNILTYLPLIVLIGCQSSSQKDNSATDNNGILGLMSAPEMEKTEADYITPDEANIVENQQPVIRKPDKIIKEANIKFEVDNYSTAKRKIDSLVQKWRGYIAKEDERYLSHKIENTITIRVSNNNFERLLNDIGQTSKRIDYKTINSIDVTEEYVDIEARLKTKHEVEKRYYEILRKATKIEDILKVENEIRKIREEIEAKEGRLNYLDNRISLSTIYLSVYQCLEYKYKPQKETNFFSRFYKALDKGWKGLLSFIIALFHIWPIILITVVGIIIFFKQEKKRSLKKSGKSK